MYSVCAVLWRATIVGLSFGETHPINRGDSKISAFQLLPLQAAISDTAEGANFPGTPHYLSLSRSTKCDVEDATNHDFTRVDSPNLRSEEGKTAEPQALLLRTKVLFTSPATLKTPLPRPGSGIATVIHCDSSEL